MKKILFLLICLFSFSVVNAEEINTDLDFKFYDINGNAYIQLYQHADILKTTFIDYINENLDPTRTYAVFLFDSSTTYAVWKSLYMFDITDIMDKPNLFFKPNNLWFVSGTSLNYYSFSISFDTFEIKTNGLKSTSVNYSNGRNMFTFITNNVRSYGTLIWSNKSLMYKADDITEDYYTYDFELGNCAYADYKYDFNKLAPNLPIYTLFNLWFGDYGEVKKSNYKIEYYFDDVLDISKTEILSAPVNSIITDFTDYSNDLYKLVEGDYSLKVTDDEANNVLKIYYRSPLYDTDKQAIDTNVKEFYFFYNMNDIKRIFPSIVFDNFTQFQQFLIVIIFNIFYCLFLFFILYITIKLVYKGLSWIFSYFV